MGSNNNPEGMKFDPMTGERLEEPKFDPMTGERLDDAKSEVTESVNETVESATESVNETVESVTDNANEVATNATENVTEATEGATGNVAPTVENVDYHAFMRDNDYKEGFIGKAKDKASRGKKGLVAGIVVGVLVIGGAVAAFANKDLLVNKFKLATSSPSEYYKYVMEKNSDEKIEDSIDTYKYAYDLLTSDKVGASANFKVEVGDDLEEALSTVGTDLYGLKSASIGMYSSLIDGATSFEGSVDINDNRLVTGDAYIDLANKEAYAKIPEISDSYINASGAFNDVDESQSKVFTDMTKFLTSDDIYLEPKVLEKELKKYRDVYLDYIVDKDAVSKEKKEVNANSVKEKQIVLSYDLDGDEVCDLALEFLKEVKKDDELKGYLENIYNVVKDMAGSSVEFSDVDVAGEWDTEIDKMIEQIKEGKEKAASYKKVLEMETYVSAKGEIRGYKITINEDEKSNISFTSLMAIKNGKLGYKASFSENDKDDFTIKGRGNADFSKINAKFTITVNMGEGKKYEINANVEDCDTTEYLKGNFKGKITLSSDDLVKDGKLVLDIDQTRKKSDISVDVKYSGKSYVKFNFETETSDDPKSFKPDSSATMVDATDNEALANYIKDFDIEQYINDFTSKAGITISYDEINSLMSSLTSKLTGNDILGGLGGDDYDYDYDYDYDEPQTEYDYDDYWETYEAPTEDSDYEYPTYDDDYWETYEYPTYDENYWETYDWSQWEDYDYNDSSVGSESEL